MFKIGQTVSKTDVWAAGWIIELFDAHTKDVTFISEDETMSVAFTNNAETAIIYSNN